MKVNYKQLIKYFFQLLFFFFSICSFYILNNISLGVFFLLCNYVVSFVVVNFRTKNLFNPSTYFLLGFGCLILGRMISKFLNFNLVDINQIFCANFFFHYCMLDNSIYFLCSLFNLTLIFFSMGHLSILKPSENKKKNHYFLIGQKQCFVDKHIKAVMFISLYIIGIYLIVSGWNTIYLSISKGYMELYANQADNYQTPIDMLFSSIFFAGLSILVISTQNKNKKEVIALNLLILIFLLNLMQKILTGSRASFINGILFAMWIFMKDKKVSSLRYLSLFLGLIFLLSFTNIIAELSGSRAFSDSDKFHIVETVLDTLYEQGGSMMVVNSSLYIQEISWLAYMKTILPGIQIFYSYFGIYDRYLFDWASWLAYQENKFMYEQGFGLGWSILSDFYLLSFKFLPIYCLFFYLFGFFLRKITISSSPFKDGLLFILMGFIFSISRNSISPVIFCFFIYFIMFFIFVKNKY